MHPVLKNHIEKKEFRHAYLLAGDIEISREMAFESAKILLKSKSTTVVDENDNGCRLETHPDFFHQQYDSFGIDDSRELIYKASQTAFLAKNKVFIIETSSFTNESANALLKLMEEPFPGTYFFIIVPSRDVVISTLRSRLVVVENKIAGQSAEEKETRKNADDFLKELPLQRLKLIEKISKDKQKSVEFLNVLELVLTEDMEKKKEMLLAEGIEEIQKSRNLLASRFGSPKIILERLALILPKM